MRSALAVAALLPLALAPSPAAAHAPLARGLALEPGDGQGVAVRMPGFGFALRARDGEPFRYACDALLGIEPVRDPTAVDVPFVFGAGGVLLIGTPRGLRALDREGCPAPASDDLAGTAVTRLTAHPDDAGLIYAVSGEPSPALYASEDGGERFALRAALAPGTRVTALVAARGDAQALYTSELDAAGQPAIALSHDGGRSLTRVAQDRPRVLLYAEPGLDGGLWAMWRDEGARMAVIERAPGPDGPWREAGRVHFFGGFAVDTRAAPVFWVGDEGGGVLRSSDGGESFLDAQPDLAVACLVVERGALWACTPATPLKPAVQSLGENAQAFEPVLALADVDQLVACAPEAEIETLCAAAWREWRADVLMEGAPVAEPSSANEQRDAGAPPAVDTGSQEPPRRGDCRIAVPGTTQDGRVFAAAFVLLTALTAAARTRPAPTRNRGHHGRPLARETRFVAPRAWHTPSVMPTAHASAPQQPEEDDGTTDGALMARAQAGDVDAFVRLYDRHAPTMLALLRRMLSSASDAEDLLQDVFLEAWQAVRSYDGARANVRTWFIVRTRSRALDRLARRAREPRPSAEAERSSGAQPRAASAGAEQRLAVRRALEALEPAVRETLELTYYAGMKAAEIAARMGVPLGTVRSRLARGLRVLSALLDDDRRSP